MTKKATRKVPARSVSRAVRSLENDTSVLPKHLEVRELRTSLSTSTTWPALDVPSALFTISHLEPIPCSVPTLLISRLFTLLEQRLGALVFYPAMKSTTT
ncbi:hypothetical protein TRVL_02534 [Trypanosoma vivax]|nr:hypothetical protein TRVL_02534 [Trypanosoma vivax]